MIMNTSEILNLLAPEIEEFVDNFVKTDSEFSFKYENISFSVKCIDNDKIELFMNNDIVGITFDVNSYEYFEFETLEIFGYAQQLIEFIECRGILNEQDCYENDEVFF